MILNVQGIGKKREKKMMIKKEEKEEKKKKRLKSDKFSFQK